jgi:outer membrane phospholipase A
MKSSAPARLGPALRLLFILGVLVTAPLSARIDVLLAPPGDTAVPAVQGLTFKLHLNNATGQPDTLKLPPQIEAAYACGNYHGKVRLSLVGLNTARPVALAAGDFAVLTLQLAENLAGDGTVVSLRLISPASNVIMFRRTDPQPSPSVPVAAAPARPTSAAGAGPGPLPSAPAPLDLSSDLEKMRRHISGYEPIYFAVGSRERLNAHFQFSFKFRLFEARENDDSEPFWKRRARELHFAYTQTSIWDLDSFSKPFYDSSYKPTLFLLQRLAWQPFGLDVSLQSGGQHESNGKGGGSAPAFPAGGLISATSRAKHPFDTRSLNTLYVLPRVRWSDADRNFVEVAARLSGYFQHDENDDIESYRGNVELTVRGGADRGLQLALHLRGRPGRHGSVEFNLTWPANRTYLLRDLAPSLGGYAQIQYFNGYGESLLDYDVRRRDQLRFGLMIVR